MTVKKANIIAQLQRDILPLQGFRPVSGGMALDMGWGRINDAFPQGTFPLGAVHELLCSGSDTDTAASAGFMGCLLSALMQNRGALVWISACRTLFPPALKSFGIEPDRVIFVDLQKERDVIWAVEEALKCSALSAVVGELPEISFTNSRRLQLVVEQSRVTGFIFRRNPRNLNTTACVSRWKITPLPSITEGGLPGIGFPRWNVELLKVRNGRPGAWQIEWAAGRFRHAPDMITVPDRKLVSGMTVVPDMTTILSDQQKKAG
jgi:protein ImuA